VLQWLLRRVGRKGAAGCANTAKLTLAVGRFFPLANAHFAPHPHSAIGTMSSSCGQLLRAADLCDLDGCRAALAVGANVHTTSTDPRPQSDGSALARALLWSRESAASLSAAGRHARQASVVELLLAHGARPTAAKREKAAPLILAVSNQCHARITAALLAAGASPRTRFKSQTALHFASDAPTISLLLHAGTPVAGDARQRTPVHTLVASSCDDAAERVAAVCALLEGGCEIDAQDADGHTPLALAVARVATLAAIVSVHQRTTDAPRLTTAVRVARFLAQWKAWWRRRHAVAAFCEARASAVRSCS